jgi:hypothetical protein
MPAESLGQEPLGRSRVARLGQQAVDGLARLLYRRVLPVDAALEHMRSSTWRVRREDATDDRTPVSMMSWGQGAP